MVTNSPIDIVPFFFDFIKYKMKYFLKFTFNSKNSPSELKNGFNSQITTKRIVAINPKTVYNELDD